MTMFLLAGSLASILALTGLAWLLRWAVLPRLCPLCAGVAGTWLGLLALHGAGWEVDLRLPAVLLGGSVVGVAGLGEAALAGRGTGTVLTWKTMFVVTGFATAYLLLEGAWAGVATGAAGLALLFFLPAMAPTNKVPAGAPPRREKLIEELKNCC